jgi:hypothetical protein
MINLSVSLSHLFAKYNGRESTVNKANAFFSFKKCNCKEMQQLILWIGNTI